MKTKIVISLNLKRLIIKTILLVALQLLLMLFIFFIIYPNKKLIIPYPVAAAIVLVLSLILAFMLEILKEITKRKKPKN